MEQQLQLKTNICEIGKLDILISRSSNKKLMP